MKNIHYVNHTHWDREWLRSSDTYRIRAMYVFDMLLEILENNKDYKYFTYDGQTAAIEDYLQIRPEKREKISKYIKEKRLLIGPWFTQPDLALVSGESLLRNLMIGSNIAENLGHCMECGWIPDAFGQIQSTPQLFKELGMKSLFVWRGFNYEYTEDSVFLWEAPNGDSILTIHFPLGYGYYRYLPEDNEEAIKDIMGFTEKVEDRFKDGEILLMGGSDHTKPQESIATTIKNIKEEVEAKGYTIKQSNPEVFTRDIKKALKENNRELEVYKGEAKSAALGRIHAGITSTRMDIKNDMKNYENMLPLVVEPMSVISSTIGGKYDQGIMNYYWKTIFKNQFHDSIYSSSPDSINQTVENRLLNLRHGLNELVWLNIRTLKDKLDFTDIKENEEVMVMFNTLPYKRNDLVLLNFISRKKDFCLKDKDGNEIPYVLVNCKEAINTEIENYNGSENYHDAAEVLEKTKFNIQVKIKGDILPSMGYKVIKVTYGEKGVSPEIDDLRLIKEREFENRYLKVKINNNGTLDVINKKNNVEYKEIHYFEEKGDDGDEYNFSPPVKDEVITTKDLEPIIEIMENNNYEIKYRITYLMDTPLECIDHIRSEERVEWKIQTEVSLKADSKKIDFKTNIDNKGKDHILKAIFEDVEECNESLSEDHFGTIVRNNKILKQVGLKNGATEEELPIYPMQRWVKLNTDKNTFAVLSKGPCEYMIYDNKSIALTLFRSVGKFGKKDLLIRPGRSSGYRLDAPSSQILKKLSFEYSLYIEEGNNLNGITRQANMLKTKVQSRQLNIFKREKHEERPWEKSVLEIGKGIEVMSFKRAENGEGYALRLLNEGKNTLENLEIKICDLGNKAYLATVREEIKEDLELKNNIISIPKIKGESFITVLIK